jgi:hypothetical protein
MSNLKQPVVYSSNLDIIDDRIFEYGQIWKIRDGLIKIPDADRLNMRDEHFCRCVIIIDNNEKNIDESFPIITVAPISHRVDCIREFDIELSKDDDQVQEDSIVRLSLSQPVLKKDLFVCEGLISEDARDSILEAILSKFGFNIEDM